VQLLQGYKQGGSAQPAAKPEEQASKQLSPSPEQQKNKP